MTNKTSLINSLKSDEFDSNAPSLQNQIKVDEKLKTIAETIFREGVKKTSAKVVARALCILPKEDSIRLLGDTPLKDFTSKVYTIQELALDAVFSNNQEIIKKVPPTHNISDQKNCFYFDALVAAATKDDLESFTLLISHSKHFDINKQQDDNFFEIACSHGSEKIVSYLIEKVNPDLAKQGLTFAVENNRLSIIPKLLNKIKETTSIDTLSTTLHLAASKGFIQMFHLLMSNGIPYEMSNGETPLIVACKNKQVDFALDLVTNKPAYLHERQPEGKSLLHTVCELGLYQLFKKFKEHGFNFSDPNETDGKSAIDYALCCTDLNVLKTIDELDLIESDEDIIPFLTYNGNITFIKEIVENRGYPLNSNNNTTSPFMIACIKNDIELITYFKQRSYFSLETFLSTVTHSTVFFFLLNQRISLEETLKCIYQHDNSQLFRFLHERLSFNLEFCLEDTYKEGALNILRYLVNEKRLDLSNTYQKAWQSRNIEFLRAFFGDEFRFRFDQTSLLLAISYDNEIALKFLIEKKHFDAHQRIDGETLLKNTCSLGSLRCTLYLIDNHNLSLFDKPIKLLPPIFYALFFNKIDFIKELLKQKKITPKDKNENGQNLLFFTSLTTHIELIDLMIEDYGFELEEKDNDNPPLLYQACGERQKETFFYLIEKRKVSPFMKKESFLPKALKESAAIALYLLGKGYYHEKEISFDFPYLEGYEQLGLALLEKGANPNFGHKDRTPLQIACEKGLVNLTKELLKNGAFAHFKADQGDFPILAACQNGHKECCEALLDHTPHIPTEIENSTGHSPLTYACRFGWLEIVKTLISRETDSFNDRPSLAHIAAKNGHLELLKWLLETQEIDLESTDSEGNTLLHNAYISDNVSLIKYLTQEKKLLNDKLNNNKETCLQTGARFGAFQSVVYGLEQEKLDPNLPDHENNTLLHFAYIGNNPVLIDFLIKRYLMVSTKNKSGNTPFHKACTSGSIKSIEYHKNNLTPPWNEKNDSGFTPLQCAAWSNQTKLLQEYPDLCQVDLNDLNFQKVAFLHGHLELIRFLVKSKFFNPVNKHDLLLFPITNGHLHVVKYLVEIFKLNPIFKTQETTPIHTAALLKQTDILLYFLACNPSYSKATDVRNRTLLHMICQTNHVQMAKTLIEQYEIDPDSTCFNLVSPLHEACIHGKKEMVQLLLSQKVQINNKDINGNTPLHYLATHWPEKVDILNLLIEAGAKINLLNNEKMSPMRCAFISKPDQARDFILILLEKGANPCVISKEFLLKDPTFGKIYIDKLKNSCYTTEHLIPFLKVNEEHFLIGIANEITPTSSTPIDFINELKSLFKTLNFLNPTKEGYIDPSKIRLDEKTFLKDKFPNVPLILEEKLLVFATNIQNRGKALINDKWSNTLLASPPLDEKGEETKERKLFFDKLQFLVSEVINKMKDSNCDQAGKREHLVHFAIAGFNCGTHYIGESTSAYELLILTQPLLFKDKIHSLYANYRKGILVDLSTDRNIMNTHLFNTYMVHLKKPRGIPGAVYEGDSFFRHQITKELAFDLFDQAYSVPSILHRFIIEFENIRSTGNEQEAAHLTKEEILNWFKDNIPDDWKKNRYSSEDERKLAYMNRCVLQSTGILKTKAFLDLLENHKIIDTSILRERGFFEQSPEEELGYDLLEEIEEEEKSLELIAKGADLTIKDPTEKTALHRAAEEGSVKVVEALLKKIVSINSEDATKMTPLHLAVKSEELSKVKALLDKNCLVDPLNEDKKTPLHLAALYGLEEIYNELIKRGADETIKDNNGKTPLYYASFKEITQTIKKIKMTHDNQGMTPLHEACRKGDVKLIEKLLANESDPNQFDNKGITPYHMAAESGNIEALKALPPFKLNILTKGRDTLLHFAAKGRNEQMITFLIEQGVNPNALNLSGLSPLYIAINSNRLNNGKLLLKKGVLFDPMTLQLCKKNGIDLAKDLEYEQNVFNGETITGKKRAFNDN